MTYTATTSDGDVAAALRRGDVNDLPRDYVNGLLLWLCGRQEGAAAPLHRALGAAANDLAVIKQAYYLLDKALFVGDRLVPLSSVQQEREKENIADVHRRYRLLVRAYHPDRFPALASHLTARSQAINAAYSNFKSECTDRRKGLRKMRARLSSSGSTRRAEQRPTRMWQAPLQDKLLGLAERLAHVHRLPQKLFALALVLLVLLLVHLQS